MKNTYLIDTAPLSNEHHFLMNTVSGRQREKEVSSGEVDFSLVLHLSRHHRLFPILYYQMAEDPAGSALPEPEASALKSIFHQNVYQMLFYSAESKRLSSLFERSQIDLIFLKGPFLGEELYGSLSLRTSGDLDILVGRDKLERAEQILLEDGYVKDEYIETLLGDWKWRHHHFSYIHPEKKIKTELHWKLNPGPVPEPPFSDLWKRRKECSGSFQSQFRLGEEDLFVFLIMHGARHGWSRLRWLHDIARLIERDRINYEKLNQLLKKYHLGHISGQATILVSSLFHTMIPAELGIHHNAQSKNLAEKTMFYLRQCINLHDEPLPEEVAAYHRRYLFDAMSVPQKALFISSFLYPYYTDAKTLPLPKCLHFLYFPLRPFLWAWRKVWVQET